MGGGRINAYKAVSNTSSKAVRAVDIQISDAAPGGNGNGIVESGETITVAVKFVNYLNPTTGLTVSLASKNSYSTVTSPAFSAGAVATLDTFDNSASRFKIVVTTSAPQSATLDFMLTYSDGTYSDYQWLSIPVNPSFATQSGNNVSLTITSKGNLGFNNYSTNTQGTGLQYNKSANLLFEGSLMLATSAAKVSDNARNSIDGAAEKTNFTTVQPFPITTPGTVADVEGSTIFNDNSATSKIGVTVNMKSYTFTDDADSSYMILRYNLANNGGAPISNLYAGLFMDFDMIAATGKGDATAYDTAGKFGYVYHPGGTPNEYIATALISSTNYGYWGLLNDGSDGGFSIYDGFSDQEKWKALSSGIGKAGAGPGDISEVVSAGAFSIPVGGSTDVAFAIAGGYSVADLRTAVAKARAKYQKSIITDVNNNKAVTPTRFNLSQNYPNPFNPTTVINYQLAKTSRVSLKVYDLLGREVSVLVDDEKPAGVYSVEFNAKSMTNSTLSSGVYFYRLQAGSDISTKKMILLR